MNYKSHYQKYYSVLVKIINNLNKYIIYLKINNKIFA